MVFIIRKYLSLLICAGILLSCTVFRSSANAAGLSVCGECAILIRADTGEVLYEKSADKRCAIASITKIMTAVIALEYAEKNDKEVTFDDSMAAEGSSLYLKNGDILRLSELVKGMMAVSGNDAANAAAIAVAGSKEAFAKLMNEKAQQLGMNNSHFVTPSGLDDDEHYSTARDMALLCSYAMENEKFKKTVSQKSIEVSYIFPEGKTQMCFNHNKLLSSYKDCIGIKTGYTKKAGRTLTSCAERDGVRLIAVTLNDSDDWNDHTKLFDYGFSLYEQKPALSVGESFELPVVGSEKDSIKVTAAKEYSISVKKDGTDKIERKLYMPHFIYAPVKKGQKIGELCFFINGIRVLQAELFADENAELQKE